MIAATLSPDDLVALYRADLDIYTFTGPEELGPGKRVVWTVNEDWRTYQESEMARTWWTRHMACRCYRCGTLLTAESVRADRTDEGHVRPVCSPCFGEPR
jgi:hypothetical protein